MEYEAMKSHNTHNDNDYDDQTTRIQKKKSSSSRCSTRWIRMIDLRSNNNSCNHHHHHQEEEQDEDSNNSNKDNNEDYDRPIKNNNRQQQRQHMMMPPSIHQQQNHYRIRSFSMLFLLNLLYIIIFIQIRQQQQQQQQQLQVGEHDDQNDVDVDHHHNHHLVESGLNSRRSSIDNDYGSVYIRQDDDEKAPPKVLTPSRKKKKKEKKTSTMKESGSAGSNDLMISDTLEDIRVEPIRIFKEWITNHGVLVAVQHDGRTSFDDVDNEYDVNDRYYVVGDLSCPMEEESNNIGVQMSDFLNNVLLAIVTNRTLLVRQRGYNNNNNDNNDDTGKIDNNDNKKKDDKISTTTCQNEILRLSSWVPRYEDHIDQIRRRVVQRHSNGQRQQQQQYRASSSSSSLLNCTRDDKKDEDDDNHNEENNKIMIHYVGGSLELDDEQQLAGAQAGAGARAEAKAGTGRHDDDLLYYHSSDKNDSSSMMMMSSSTSSSSSSFVSSPQQQQPVLQQQQQRPLLIQLRRTWSIRNHFHKILNLLEPNTSKYFTDLVLKQSIGDENGKSMYGTEEDTKKDDDNDDVDSVNANSFLDSERPPPAHVNTNAELPLQLLHQQERIRQLYSHGPVFLYGMFIDHIFTFHNELENSISNDIMQHDDNEHHDRDTNVDNKKDNNKDRAARYNKHMLDTTTSKKTKTITITPAVVPITVGIHSRHPSEDDDGTDITREVACLDHILQQQQLLSASSWCYVIIMSDRIKTIHLLEDNINQRNCTTLKVANHHYHHHTKSKQRTHNMSSMLHDQYNISHHHRSTKAERWQPQRRRRGEQTKTQQQQQQQRQHHNRNVEHGPYAGIGYFQDVILLSKTVRSAMIGSFSRSSTLFPLEMIEYRRFIEQQQHRQQQQHHYHHVVDDDDDDDELRMVQDGITNTLIPICDLRHVLQ